jgi:hypothetical protein
MRVGENIIINWHDFTNILREELALYIDGDAKGFKVFKHHVVTNKIRKRMEEKEVEIENDADG